jgi:6-phosphogluconolactonase
LTLAASVLNAGRLIVFLVSGADKRQALAEVLHGARDPAQLPAQLIAPASGRLLWLVDEAAAGSIA